MILEKGEFNFSDFVFFIIKEEPVLKLTGRDAVEYFAKCHHIGKIQSIYFNVADSRHFRPYDLVSVHKNKVSYSAHVVIYSSFFPPLLYTLFIASKLYRRERSRDKLDEVTRVAYFPMSCSKIKGVKSGKKN